jgi:iron(III) transport system permease protein
MKSSASHLRKKRFQWSGEISINRLGLFFFIVIVFGPLFALVVNLGQTLLGSDSSWLELPYPGGRQIDLLIRSVTLSACVALASMLLGILAGSSLWRWQKGAVGYLRWLVLLIVVIPPYVHALGWISAANAVNSVMQSIGLPKISLGGWFASWWVQIMALSPIAVGMTLIGFESVEPALIEAAQVMRQDVDNLKKIILPLAAPSILAGGGFVFLLSLTDYSVPSLFQINVYPIEIFAEYSASNAPANAFILALPLLLITILVVSFSQAPLRNAALRPFRRHRAWINAPIWPGWFVLLQRLALGIVAAQILVPLICLAVLTGTWLNLIGGVTSSRREIFFTFWTSALTGIACLPMALAAARKLMHPSSQGKLWWLLVTAPLAVPAPLVGIGLISIWNQPFFGDFYGSDLMPVFASLARFTPLAAIVLLAQLRRLDPLLIDAARVLHTSRVRTLFQIRLPLLTPGLIAGGFIAFALCAGELGATLLVAPPGQATLTMRIYNYLHYGASDVVAGLCLMMTAATLVAGILAIAALQGWSRLFPFGVMRSVWSL